MDWNNLWNGDVKSNTQWCLCDTYKLVQERASSVPIIAKPIAQQQSDKDYEKKQSPKQVHHSFSTYAEDKSKDGIFAGDNLWQLSLLPLQARQSVRVLKKEPQSYFQQNNNNNLLVKVQVEDKVN